MNQSNTNTSALRHFDNLELDTHIRVLIQDDQPHFAAKDICTALEISNTRDATEGLDADELVLLKVTSGGQKRDLQFVTESGLYALIFKSRKEAAKKFRKWVTSEVLPAIRREGRYDPAELAAQMPPSVRRAYLLAEIDEAERLVAMLRRQADLAQAIPGQLTVWQWLMLQGEEPGNSCASLSSKCRRLANERGIVCGLVKVIEHCGQVTRLSRTAYTYPEEILIEVIGQAA